jgi:aminoglycoside 3-N-acetyltransferase
VTDQTDLPIITKSQLVHDLTRLGVEAGQTVMLHASVRAIGWIVGGPDVVLQALCEVLTPEGTLMMYAGWEEQQIEHFDEWPPARQAAYLAECPPFDPATARANRKWSILTEYLRTIPGTQRSANPCASMVAAGAKAQWLTENHPLQYGYGPASPLAKLREIGGKILQIGVPIETLTLLHYSEHMANVPRKRIVRFRVPLLRDGQRVWVETEEFDTSQGIRDWPGGNYFAAIAQDFLASGHGRSGTIGAAQAHLLDAATLHAFAVEWLEREFTV